MPLYDVIITGAGLAGLVCGEILSRNGMSVCILEKNSRIGGCLQSFKRKGVTFDTGVHYIGSFDEGQILERCFTYLGLTGRISVKKMNEDGYDLISFGGDDRLYRHPVGAERFCDTLSSMFPAERENLNLYCETLKKVNDAFPINNLTSGEMIPATEYFGTSTIRFLQSITGDRKLQNVLAGSNLLYSGISDHTPMYIHSLINYSYMLSAYKLVGGSEQIADILSSQIRQNGGEIITSAEVTNYVHDDRGAIKSVMLKNGEAIEGKKYISTIHPSLTVRMIDPVYVRKAYIQRISGLPNTISVFGLYIVLKDGCFPAEDCNYYHYSGDNVWVAESYDPAGLPEGFFMSSTPQSYNEQYARGVNVLACMKFSEVERWAGTSVGRRGDEYNELKEVKARAVLDLIEKRFPGFNRMVESYYTSSPLTYRDYTGTVDGSIYGISRDSDNFMNSHISTRTKIPNLFMAGQSVSLHGVLGVTISSIMACGNLLGLGPLLEKIKNC